LAWSSGSASAILRAFGPEELGGVGDVLAKARVLAEATGRSIEEIIGDVTIFFVYNMF